MPLALESLPRIVRVCTSILAHHRLGRRTASRAHPSGCPACVFIHVRMGYTITWDFILFLRQLVPHTLFCRRSRCVPL